MTRYLVKRSKDTVEVLILPNKDGSGYQYVNLTKGHICPCKFETCYQAVMDMINKVNTGEICAYIELPEVEVKPC